MRQTEIQVQTEYKRRMWPLFLLRVSLALVTSTHIPLPQFSTVINLAVMKTGKYPYCGWHCVQVQAGNSIASGKKVGG